MAKTKVNDPRPAGKRAKDKEANKSRTKALKRKNQLKSAETKQEKKSNSQSATTPGQKSKETALL